VPAVILAWEAVNQRITLGRGADFRMGHGVFLEHSAPASNGVADAVAFLREPWRRIEAHVEEVFFGDTRGIGAALGVREGTGSHPYALRRVEFVDQIVFELDRPRVSNDADFYRLLQAVIGP
jgi:5-methylcytosine-specific restriction protein B